MTVTASYFSTGLKNAGVLSALWLCAHSSYALEWDMRAGVTDMSQRIQALHHISLGVCIVISILVFGTIFYTTEGLFKCDESMIATWFTSFCYSVAALTSLGFGELTDLTQKGQRYALHSKNSFLLQT